jgi:hypothetical protein
MVSTTIVMVSPMRRRNVLERAFVWKESAWSLAPAANSLVPPDWFAWTDIVSNWVGVPEALVTMRERRTMVRQDKMGKLVWTLRLAQQGQPAPEGQPVPEGDSDRMGEPHQGHTSRAEKIGDW